MKCKIPIYRHIFMKGMKYLLLFMNKEIIIRFTILHAHITHPVQKKRH